MQRRTGLKFVINLLGGERVIECIILSRTEGVEGSTIVLQVQKGLNLLLIIYREGRLNLSMFTERERVKNIIH